MGSSTLIDATATPLAAVTAPPGVTRSFQVISGHCRSLERDRGRRMNTCGPALNIRPAMVTSGGLFLSQ